MFRMLVEIHEKQEETDEEYDDEIWFDDLDEKIFFFKHKVNNWLKEGEKIRKSDQVSRCSSKSSSKYSSKSSAKSSFWSKLSSSTKTKAIEEKVKVAELMMEAFFIKKRSDGEYQTRSPMVEEELAKAQSKAKIYENESKIGQSFANLYLSTKEMMDQKTIYEFSLHSLHLILCRVTRDT